MRLSVPHYCQYNIIKRPDWKERACGVVGLKMILEYHKEEKVDVEELIDEGVFLSGYQDGVGWKHDALVILARNHGLSSYREEFRSMTINLKKGSTTSNPYEKKLLSAGISKITRFIIAGEPVLVSVARDFEDHTKPHMVVVTGFEGSEESPEGFYINDPRNADGDTYVTFNDFMSAWRKFAIFFYPQSLK